MKLKDRKQFAYNFVKQFTKPVKVWLWCGYAIVCVYNKSADVKYWNDTCMRSDLQCINDKGEILFIVDFYFDNGEISEFNRVWAYDFKDAVSRSYDFAMLRNMKGAIFA
jgi:hypothetical protein